VFAHAALVDECPGQLRIGEVPHEKIQGVGLGLSEDHDPVTIRYRYPEQEFAMILDRKHRDSFDRVFAHGITDYSLRLGKVDQYHRPLVGVR